MTTSSQISPKTPSSPGRAIVRRVVRFLWVVAAIYVAIVLIMVLFENYLIFPAPKYPDGVWKPKQLQVEDIFFTSGDGTRLHGWYIPHSQPLAYVVYYHGNAEHLGYLSPLFQRLHDLGMAIFAFDYRGYGRSDGSPNEKGVMADGLAAHDWFARREGIPRDQIVLMGRSIGGAVAVNAAIAHGAKALILENTFTSVPDVAAKFYWWLPVRWFIRSQFDSVAKISQFRGPLLQSHGTADSIIPFELAKRLFNACPSPTKQFSVIEGGDHNDYQPEEYYAVLQRFLEALPRVEQK